MYHILMERQMIRLMVSRVTCCGGSQTTLIIELKKHMRTIHCQIPASHMWSATGLNPWPIIFYTVY